MHKKGARSIDRKQGEVQSQFKVGVMEFGSGVLFYFISLVSFQWLGHSFSSEAVYEGPFILFIRLRDRGQIVELVERE